MLTVITKHPHAKLEYCNINPPIIGPNPLPIEKKQPCSPDITLPNERSFSNPDSIAYVFIVPRTGTIYGPMDNPVKESAIAVDTSVALSTGCKNGTGPNKINATAAKI